MKNKPTFYGTDAHGNLWWNTSFGDLMCALDAADAAAAEGNPPRGHDVAAHRAEVLRNYGPFKVAK